MTLLPESLEDLIAREGLPSVAVKMLKAIQNVHQELGVIHKDIKPDNFRVKDGNVYLVDFGLQQPYMQEG
jgi:tRNA A-37 threonylcarbamoyl transferase component Bud32